MRWAPFIPIWLDELGLSAAEFRVLCALWRRRNPNTGQCNPGVDTIAAGCKMNRKTVFKCLKRLEDIELISREHRYRNANHFILHVPSVVPNGAPTEETQSSHTSHESSQSELLSCPKIASESSQTRHQEGTQGRKTKKVHNLSRENLRVVFQEIVLSEADWRLIEADHGGPIPREAVEKLLLRFNFERKTYFRGDNPTLNDFRGFLIGESSKSREKFVKISAANRWTSHSTIER